MTGDSDFIRVVARARHRFSKKVIISGIPGSVSNDLIASSDAADPIVEADWATTVPAEVAAPIEPAAKFENSIPELASHERQLIQLIDRLDRTKPYLTFLFVKTHALSPTTQLDFTPMQVDVMMTKFKELGIIRDEVREQEGRTLRFLLLVREHPLVKHVLNGANQTKTGFL
jgi:hypothetical protein